MNKKNVNNKEVGARISKIRRESGLTMKEFGEKISKYLNSEIIVSGSLISRWESGVNLPNNERLKVIAELGNMTVDELLNGIDWHAYDKKYADQLKKVGIAFKEFESFKVYLESLSYELETHSSGVTIKKDKVETNFNLDEFNDFQNEIKRTVEFQLWQQSNKD